VSKRAIGVSRQARLPPQIVHVGCALGGRTAAIEEVERLVEGQLVVRQRVNDRFELGRDILVARTMARMAARLCRCPNPPSHLEGVRLDDERPVILLDQWVAAAAASR
jgi:hypothetical protein